MLTDSGRAGKAVLRTLFAAFLVLAGFHLSMVATSTPLSSAEERKLETAVELLAARGFKQEAFLLEHTVTFRRSDNWLNALARTENAFAATNFPFQIMTLYADFYGRASDDTERAMVLLHEAQHLMNKDEAAAYEYVWRHRQQLGWTQMSHGTSPTYVSIRQLTREHAPELFTCPANLWNDCTEPEKAE